MPGILGNVLDLITIEELIAERRRALGLSQSELAGRVRLSRATVEALENGRSGEVGFGKVSRLLAAIGCELRVGEARLRQPTLEALLEEDRDAQGVGRRG
jgi:transcriptional regulator with XRE-family HTH domain